MDQILYVGPILFYIAAIDDELWRKGSNNACGHNRSKKTSIGKKGTVYTGFCLEADTTISTEKKG